MIENCPANRDDESFDSLESAIESLPINYRVLAELSIDRTEPEEDRADFLASLAVTGLPAAKFILSEEAKGSGPAAESAKRALTRFREKEEPTTPAPGPFAASLDEIFGGMFGGGSK